MSDFTDELIAIARCLGLFERDAVCCGTVTVQQCGALQALLGGSHDIGQLAEHLRVSNPATTRMVDGLEKRGWVERIRSPEDRRRVAVELTEAGRDEAERLRQLTEVGVASVLARIPAEEHATILRSLKLLRGAWVETTDVLAAGGCR
jgi:DNA-binding MarR family transcriptional regulator